MTDGFRHEYKFLISSADVILLKHRLKGIMALDSHAGPSGQYTISSLYFDDANYQAYRDKIDGVAHRVKYRIRFYNSDLSTIRLEKKEKHRDLCRKTGEFITQEDALRLQNRQPPLGNSALLSELHCGIRCGLKPAVLVVYDRTPFVCNAGQTRITIDEHIRTKPYSYNLGRHTQAMIPVLEPGFAVLEVKFNDFLPGHLSQALVDIPKSQLAISKYALCLNAI